MEKSKTDEDDEVEDGKKERQEKDTISARKK
jgi:hypothetical protein